MRTGAWWAACALVAWGRTATAAEPEIVYPQIEEQEMNAGWRSHRRGPSLFVEAGLGALYSPEMRVTFQPTVSGDDVSYSSERLLGPTAVARWGVNYGATPNVDLRVGLGSYLGGAILEAGDQFFAYPQALFSVAFGPGSVYRASVGFTVGAFILELNDRRIAPQTAQFAAHGEVAPLILRFGPHDLLEIAITQGLGVIVGEDDQFAACEVAVGTGCVSAEPAEKGTVVRFAGHTMLTFGAVID
jgi:hypothetical protein